MEFVADFHIHSKYSRATSKSMDTQHLAEWAKLKGITLIGTGDFTHHLWLEELKNNLEDLGNGLFKYQDVYFILTSEISSIYSKGGRCYRIHNMVFSPSFKTTDKINEALGRRGNLASDGRPILGLDAAELARIIFDIDENCMVVPAHCLLPDTLIHAQNALKKIKEINKGDLVYTHKLNYRKVTKVLKRPYKGKIYHIKPYYFRAGLKTTPEHPFYIIKTYKNCRLTEGICRPNCSALNECKRKYFQSYNPLWCQAKDIEKGDIIIFPRFKNDMQNIKNIEISQFINSSDFILGNGKIYPKGNKVSKINNGVRINKEFCRLAGYFISEGYTNNRDCIAFSFRANELNYIKDVKKLMQSSFGISLSKLQVKKSAKGIELVYYSKILLKLFSKLFYTNPLEKKAYSKSVPNWMLSLPLDKQAEIVRGWWRGDTGYTSSRTLMNQMKKIFLRLGIIPSIVVDSKEEHKNRGRHKIGKREIFARYDSFHFSNLSFFQDDCRLLEDVCFKKFKTKLKRRHGWIDEKYIYTPVRDIEVANYKGNVYNLEVDKDNSYVSEFAIIHNCWTPWFSLFGSMSGFDRIEDCFEDQTPKIFALETGLSSDPAMNWRLSALDKYSLISNSDSHSPSKIGREANVFDCELDYKTIREVLKTKDKKRFLYTIEFFPEEGKYHFDGHRTCSVRLSPEETRKNNGKCPKCGKPVTVGVMNRVEQLADREEGFVPPSSIPYKNLIPLEEIIAAARGVGRASVAVAKDYRMAIAKFGTELEILLRVPQAELLRGLSPKVADGVLKVREGKVDIKAGYDGEYGKISIFKEGEQRNKNEQQLSLF
ncbi:MAG: hypothetical protein KKC42_03760 [Candidatus Omnitrophica bacterium]|nr:hypothetical protein [Candidatus Omnitrophota bacterium]